MAKMEECVRSVQMDGLVWGASKLVPVGYGIKKLQIQCVVEDDKVGTDILEEEITKFEDYVSLPVSREAPRLAGSLLTKVFNRLCRARVSNRKPRGAHGVHPLRYQCVACACVYVRVFRAD